MADKETRQKEYWNYKKRINNEGEVVEVSKANPDVVSDEQAVEWNRPKADLSEIEDQMLAAYYRAIDHGALKTLSVKERRYWKAAFFHWISFVDIAKKEKVSVNSVTMTIRRAAGKLKLEAYREIPNMMISKNGTREFKGTLVKQNNDFVTAQGFSKKVREEGTTEFDKHFKDAYAKNKDEIAKFLKAHPECK